MWRRLLFSSRSRASLLLPSSTNTATACCAGARCALGFSLVADVQASARQLARGVVGCVDSQSFSGSASTSSLQQTQQRRDRQLLPAAFTLPQQPQRSLFTAARSLSQQQHQHQQQPQQSLLQQLGGAGSLQHQLQQRRGVKVLRPYAEAPKLPPRFRKPSKDGRLNRMVIRIPPQVQLAVQDGKLLLTGKAGSMSLDLATLDPSGMVAWQCLSQSAAAAAQGPGTGSLLLMVSPGKRHWRSIQTHIDNAVAGVMQGYLVGLTVQGVGYRMEPVPLDVVKAAVRARRGDAAAEAIVGSSSGSSSSSKRQAMFWEQEAEKTNIAYPHKQPAQAVRLKVGYTKAAIFPLPEGVLGLFVKPTLMYLFGTDKQLVTNTAAAIRAVRRPNAYTGNGIQLVGETVRLKQRAGSK